MSVPVALSYQVEPHISSWLDWLRKETEKGRRLALARDLLYVGLGIVSGRSEAICAYFAETLRLQKVISVIINLLHHTRHTLLGKVLGKKLHFVSFQVFVHQRQLEQWKTLFTSSCLSEAELTARWQT